MNRSAPSYPFSYTSGQTGILCADPGMSYAVYVNPIGSANYQGGYGNIQSSGSRKATAQRRVVSPKYKPKKIKGSNVVPQAGWVLVKRQPHNMTSDCVARIVFHRTLGTVKAQV